MKKISLGLIGLLLAITGFFSSCSKDTTTVDALVSIKSSTDTTVSPNATFIISWDARKGDSKMKKVTITKNDAALTGWNGKEIPSASSEQYIDYATLTADPNAGVYNYKVLILDSDDAILGSATVKITVKAAGEINTYSAILMGGQLNANLGSFLATTTGTVYQLADAKTHASAVDILYFYGTTKAATLASPDDADAATVSDLDLGNFSKLNATRFGTSTLSSSDFAAITDDTDIANISGLSATKANNLSANTVLSFKTEAGKIGLILVKEITGTTGADRAIKIDVKVQK